MSAMSRAPKIIAQFRTRSYSRCQDRVESADQHGGQFFGGTAGAAGESGVEAVLEAGAEQQRGDALRVGAGGQPAEALFGGEVGGELLVGPVRANAAADPVLHDLDQL